MVEGCENVAEKLKLTVPAVVQVDNATLSFIDAEGAPWDLPTKSSVSDGSASPN